MSTSPSQNVCLVACTDERGALTYYGRRASHVDSTSLRAAVTTLVHRGLVVVDQAMLDAFGGSVPGAHVAVLGGAHQRVASLPADGICTVESPKEAIAMATARSLPLFVLGGVDAFDAFWSAATSVRIYITAWKATESPTAEPSLGGDSKAAQTFPHWEMVLRAAATPNATNGMPRVDVYKFDYGLQFSAKPMPPADLCALSERQQ